MIRPVQPANPTGRPGRPYITRDGNALSCAGRPWKGSITNIAWLGLGYTNWQQVSTNWYPTHRQVDLAYQQCQALGHNLVRGYSIMPTFGHAMTCFPTLAAPNDAAFLAQDYAIARAADYGLYVKGVGCDPYCYYVGGTDYSTALARHPESEPILSWSAFLGGNGSDFFTNSTVISGYLDHLTLYLRRRNTYNGIRYCDDPTLSFWHLGNEIGGATDAWVSRVATHIRTIAPRMLIVDGRSLSPIPAGALANPDVDVVSRHFYPCSVVDLNAVFATAGIGNKAVSLDEFDEHNVRGGDPFLPTFRDALLGYAAQIGIVGPWQLGGFNDDRGYVLYPTPGPYVGQDDANPGYDVQLTNPARSNIAGALRSLGYSVRGVAEPAWPVPGIPMLSAAGSALRWPGVPGAASYTVERSAGAIAFAPVATGLWDADLPWTDPAPPGGGASYRVRAVNPDGVASHPSNVVAF